MTKRKLGAILGVEAMALYRHLPGKEDLLDAVVDALLSELDQDERLLREPEFGWQDFLQRLAHGVRAVALRHPKAFPLVASRPPEAPWLRPPLRSLTWVERFLQALSEEGFDDPAAAAAYRAYTSFLLGHLLLEAAAHGADITPLDVREEPEESGGALASFPAVRRLAHHLAQDHALAEFEEALEDLLERLRPLSRGTSATGE
jgi:AcrR family transcriptional regulator